MYNVSEDMIHDLESQLKVNGLNSDDYTEEDLTVMLNNAVSVIGSQYVEGTLEHEKITLSEEDSITTLCYPVVVESVVLTLDNQDVSDKVDYITNEGIITFKKPLSGELRVEYLNCADGDVLEQYIVLVALHLLKAGAGKNLASITEGDVSISYNTAGADAASLDRLVSDLHGMYGARVQLL